MGEDRYIDDKLAESIEAIQEALGLNTFREASEIYDKMARSSTLGEIIEKHRDSEQEVEKDRLESIEEELQNRNEDLLQNV